MSRLPFGEIFGIPTSDRSAAATSSRAAKHCPFRDSRCTKSSTKDPIGVCSLTTGQQLVTLCPVRFLQHQRLFADAGRLAFGPGARIAAVPEVRVLRIEGKNGHQRKIGKIDFLIGKLDPTGRPTDFAALEVQAVYFSGSEVRTAMKQYLRSGALTSDGYRRPDWRSSIQKRLMPQLSLKVPLFRRWGKKFFVATDRSFFEQIPAMRTVRTLANSEVSWLIYPFSLTPQGYEMGAPSIQHTQWDDVLDALREGAAPEPAEILAEIGQSILRRNLPILQI